MRLVGSIAAAASVLASACVFPHEMERAGPPGAPCPSVSEPPAVDAPPDTTRLRWYRSTVEGDQRRGTDWCATVGAPELRLEPSGRFGELRVGDSLSVVSWSMQVGGGDLRALLATELGLRCAADGSSLTRGAPPFVLLLQNAYRTSDALPATVPEASIPRTVDPPHRPEADEDVADIARACGLALLYVASERNGPDSGSRPREDRGNAILSTLPLTIPVAVDLPFEGSRAVAVGATVRLPRGERMRMVSAHIDGLTTLARTLIGGNQTRARQVRGLIDGLDEADDDGPLTAATLLGADLGIWDDGETAVQALEAAFPESPARDGRKTRGPFASDRIFFRRGSFRTITVGRHDILGASYGSDHVGRRVIVNYFPLP